MYTFILLLVLVVVVVLLYVASTRQHPVRFLFRPRHTMPPATAPAAWYTQPSYPADSHQDLGDQVVT